MPVVLVQLLCVEPWKYHEVDRFWIRSGILKQMIRRLIKPDDVLAAKAPAYSVQTAQIADRLSWRFAGHFQIGLATIRYQATVFRVRFRLQRDNSSKSNPQDQLKP